MVRPSTPALPWFSRTRFHARKRLARAQTSSINPSSLAGRSGALAAVRSSSPCWLGLGTSSLSPAMKASDNCLSWMFCRCLRLRRASYLPLPIVQAFGQRSRCCLAVCRPFRLPVPYEPYRLPDLLCPLLTSVAWSGSLAGSSVSRGDTSQISRGKFDRLPRTPAGSTAAALDGYGLCDQLPARPTADASYPVSVRQVAVARHAPFRRHLTMTPWRSCSSFTAIRLDRGLAPPGYRTCSAHNETTHYVRVKCLFPLPSPPSLRPSRLSPLSGPQ